MLPDGIKHRIIWQCLLDRMAPVVHAVNIYICLYVCVWGASPIGLILSDVLLLAATSLSFVAAAGWIVVLRAFSMAECGELVSVCFWQETRWPTERRAKMMIAFCIVNSPFSPSLSVWHTHPHILWGNVWNTAHQLGINNSVILHCVNVYVSLVAEHGNFVLY